MIIVNIDNNYEMGYENNNYIEGDYNEGYEDTQYQNNNQYYNNDYYDENEEDYYYEEPSNSHVTYYLPNKQKNRNVSNSYIKPKITYNKSQANIYNYSNNGINNKYKFSVNNNVSTGTTKIAFRGNKLFRSL